MLEDLGRLALYDDILANPIGQSYCAMLRSVADDESQGAFVAAVARLSGLLSAHAERRAAPSCGDVWQDYLLTNILEAENTFTRNAARVGPARLSPALTALARQDLAILQALYQLKRRRIARVRRPPRLARRPTVSDVGGISPGEYFSKQPAAAGG